MVNQVVMLKIWTKNLRHYLVRYSITQGEKMKIPKKLKSLENLKKLSITMKCSSSCKWCCLIHWSIFCFSCRDIWKFKLELLKNKAFSGSQHLRVLYSRSSNQDWKTGRGLYTPHIAMLSYIILILTSKDTKIKACQ